MHTCCVCLWMAQVSLWDFWRRLRTAQMTYKPLDTYNASSSFLFLFLSFSHRYLCVWHIRECAVLCGRVRENRQVNDRNLFLKFWSQIFSDVGSDVGGDEVTPPTVWCGMSNGKIRVFNATNWRLNPRYVQAADRWVDCRLNPVLDKLSRRYASMRCKVRAARITVFTSGCPTQTEAWCFLVYTHTLNFIHERPNSRNVLPLSSKFWSNVKSLLLTI